MVDWLLDRVVVEVCGEVDELSVVRVVEEVSVAEDVSVVVVEEVRVAEVVTVLLVVVVVPFEATGIGPPVEPGGPVVDTGGGDELCGVVPAVPVESLGLVVGAVEAAVTGVP